MLRASGVDWDLRHRNPYDFYDKVSFRRPLGTVGDNNDRYLVRLHEIRESLKIIEQCLDLIEPGPIKPEEVPFLVRPPEGDSYVPIEAPKGELGFYLVSDGGISPFRCHVRAPSLMNLTLLREAWFDYSTTLGLRENKISRWILPRRIVSCLLYTSPSPRDS